MIIDTSDNRFYRVSEIADSEMAHLWHGTELKRVKGLFVEKTTRAGKQINTYVRKAATRVVEVA